MQLLPLRRTMVCSARLANLGASFFRGVTLPFTRHYWFAPGCKRSYQFARYAFALLYLYLAYLWLGYFGTVTDIGNYVDAFLIVNNPNLYRPISVFHFLGNSLPPALFLKLCLVLLKWCPITLLFGVFSRASLAGCILGLFGLSFIQYSYSPQWSHGFSPILVASLVFLLGPRHHDGFDGWWRRRTGRTWTPADDHRARAAVMAAQMMIALVFLNAAFFKVYAYGEGLRGFLPWVFSDNLRNTIIRQHVVFDVPLREPFRFIVSHPFAYRGLALGNMLAQTLPFVGCLLVRRPWLRLLCGAALGMEVLGLGIIMGIWNLHWLLFLVFFLDWDRLVFGQRSAAAPPHPEAGLASPGAAAPWWRPGAEGVHGFALAVLFAFNGYVMFWHADQRPWTFPFTSYPMFSNVVAEKPYRQHLPYYIPVSGFAFDSDRPLAEKTLRANWLCNWGILWDCDARDVCHQIRTHLAAHEQCTIYGMRGYRALLRVPPPPACDPEEVLKLPTCEYRDGAYRTVAYTVILDQEKKQLYLEYRPLGFQAPTIHLKYYTRDGEGPFDLPYTRAGNRYYLLPRPAQHQRIVIAFEIHEPDQSPVTFCGPMF